MKNLVLSTKLTNLEKKNISSYFLDLSFKKKDFIYRKKENKRWFFDENEKKTWIYFIKKWIVKILINHSWKNYTIAFLKEWDFFGELSSILWFEPNADVIAVEDTEIDFLSSDDFNNLTLKIPQFSVNITKYLANRIQALSSTIFDHVFRPLESRVASNILNLSNEFWIEKGENKIIISIKVTHQDLSDFIWTNRETVTKILNLFKKKWLIDFIDRKIFITDFNWLKKIAEV